MSKQWNESTATAKGLYDPRYEHDNCGIGAVVNIKGIKTHETVENALKIVENLKHRAGKDADGKTGDGVGILLQISHKFFKKVTKPLGIELGDERDYGVGMFFFPNDEFKTIQAKKMLEVIVEKEGLEFLGWREVPTEPDKLSKKARDCMPCIMQCFVKKPKNVEKGLDFDRKLYIADGHHRYETALNYRNYCRENGLSKVGDPCDYQMIYLVDMEHPGLVVFPTHRLVRDLQDFNVEKVLDGCREYFDVTEMNGTDNMESELAKLYDEGKKAFGFYVGNGKWYRLVLKNLDIMDKLLPELSKPSRQLDVTVLHSLVLERIFGIDKENMANQINLTYTKFFSEAVEGVDNGKFQCSFVLNPTRVTEIRDVAAAGEKMPQKSTYFYPKMITGMVMNDIGVE